VPDTDGHDAAGAGPEAVGAAVEEEDRRAVEDVEALLEGVHVRVDRAMGLEPAHPDRHVNRPGRRVHERAASESAARVGVRRPEADLISAQDVVHRIPLPLSPPNRCGLFSWNIHTGPGTCQLRAPLLLCLMPLNLLLVSAHL
jgi:hypothetical protein